jgi:hypothetical protein
MLVFAIGFMFMMGLYFGTRLQARQDTGTVASVAQSGRIAVVNQDMGALHNGEQLYFAANIIETLTADFILTSRTIAETGLANGNFVAVINFPVNFSESIARINSVRPETARFSYRINENLSQRDSIKTLLRVLDLEQHINETISYMFVASIIGELHGAQAVTSELLTSNKADMAAVNAFAVDDLWLSFATSQASRQYPEITMISFQSFVNESNQILMDIHTQYIDGNEDTWKSYEQLIKGFTDVTDMTSVVLDEAVAEIEILPTDDNGTGLHVIHGATREVSQLELEEIENAIIEICDEILDMIHEHLIFVYDDPDVDDDDIDNTDLLDAKGNDLDDPDNILEEFREWLIETIEEYFFVIGNSITEFKESQSEYFDIMTEETIDYVLQRQTEIKDSLSMVFTEVVLDIEKANKVALAFEPMEHINKRMDELDDLTARYMENNRSWSAYVNESINDKKELLYEIHVDYGEHLQQLQADIQTASLGTRQRIDNAQNELLDKMMDSYDYTNQLIGDFAKILPNSRIGVLDNTDFYSFIVTPITAEEVGQGTQTAFLEPAQGETIQGFRIPNHVIMVLSSVFIVLSLVMYRIMQKVK